MKKMIAVMAMSMLTTSVFADQIYGGAGTTGLKLGYAHAINDTFGIRGEYNGLNFSRDFNTSDADYAGKLKFNSIGAYLDYFPFGNAFRLSAGALIGNNKISADGKVKNGTFTINGQQYNAAGESVSVSADWPKVQPYLGLGYGFAPKSTGGFGFFADLGVAFGKPDAKLNVSPGLQAIAGQANIAAERNKLQDKLDNLRFYPVLAVGVSYSF